MKLLQRTSLLLPFLLPNSAYANILGCITSDAVSDDLFTLFTEQVAPVYSQFWNITYYDTYKIFTNKASNLTYLFYQCGTEPPIEEVENGGHAGIMEIADPAATPVTIASTPMISYLELLGLRTNIKGFLGSESLISSPCLLDLIDSGSVTVAPDGTNATTLAAVGLLDSASQDMLTFVSGWTGDILFNNTIVMEEYTESSYEGTMEWIKAYGAIFNLEGEANAIFEQANCRFEAIEADVASVTSDLPVKPKILWAYYSDYCGGWDVAECPNYYCGFATACNAEVLNSTEGSAGLELCGAPYMTTEEFLAFGKDADHWIYPSVNWNSIYAENEAVLSQFKSVMAESVFDYQGGGSNAWFEQRFAEYDVALNDFCLVAGTAVSVNAADRRLWFRNVFTEPVGSLEKCEDPEAPYEPRGNAWTNCGKATEEMPLDDTEETDGEPISTENDEPSDVAAEEEEQKPPLSGSLRMALIDAAILGLVAFLAV